MEQEYRYESVLRELYWDEGLNIKEVSDRLDCDKDTVHRWMKKHDIERETASQDKPVHYRTKEDGYETWRHSTNGKQYVVRVHRLASVAWYGYDAVVDKDIHHENHIPWDNREFNITPLDPQDHRKYHAKQLQKYTDYDIPNNELRDYIYRDGKSINELSQIYNVPFDVVREVVEDSPVWYPVNPYRWKFVLEELIDSYDVSDIANHFNISKNTVTTYLNKHGIDGWRRKGVETVEDKYDREKLKTMFFDDDMTMCEIADEYGTTQGAVSQCFNKLDIETGYKTSDPDEKPWRDKEKLEQLYCEKEMSMADITEKWNCSHGVISKWCRKHGLT